MGAARFKIQTRVMESHDGVIRTKKCGLEETAESRQDEPIVLMNLDFSPSSIAHYRTVALQVAIKAGADYNSAEDVAQESLIKLFENREKVESQNAVVSWLATTSRRLWFKRASECRRNVPLLEHTARVDAEAVVSDKLAADWEKNKLNILMDELPSNQRELIDAIYLQELSYSEVSQKLGIAIGTVGPARGRALQRLFHGFGSAQTA